MPDRMTRERLAEIEQIRREASGSRDDWVGGDPLIGTYAATTNQTPHQRRVWYPDGDLLADVHENLGLGLVDAHSLSHFLAESPIAIDQLTREVRRCWAQMEAQGAIVQRLTEQLRANGLEPDLRPAKK